MSELSAQLAALGIPAPSSPVVVNESPADIVMAVVAEYLKAGDSADPMVGLELLHMLRWAQLRLETELARTSGCSVTKKIERPPTRRVTKTYFGKPVEVDEECPHRCVEVDEKQSLLTCTSCGAFVNPVWWLARNTKEVTRAEEWRVSVAKDAARVRTELEELKAELSRTKQKNKRAKQTGAKQALRADGSDYLIPPAPKRKRPRKS